MTRLNKFLLILAIVTTYAAFVVAQTPPGAYNSPSLGGGGGLPAGLTYVAPTLTVSTAGTGNGTLALSGNTSGTATITAPAVAGTITNGLTFSNGILVPDGTTASPSLAFSAAPGTGFIRTGGNIGVVTGGQSLVNFNCCGIDSYSYQTFVNCAVSSASPAACGNSSGGMVAVPVAATTYTVNTSIPTTNSEVFIVQNTSTTAGTRLGVTCNTTANLPLLTAVVNITSFTFSLTAPVTNPACYNFWIIN